MKALFVYYSHTNTLATVARFVAKENSSFDIERIEPVKTIPKGFWGMLIGGRQAMKAVNVDIRPALYNPSDYDVIILASPVWASHVSPAMRRYITDHKAVLANKKIGFLTVSGGGVNDRAMNDMSDLIGNNNIPRLGLSKKIMMSDDGRQMAKEWFSAFLSIS